MTFRTREELFKSLLLPFRLTNALACFQNFINDTLAWFLHTYIMTSFNDIVINTDTMDGHRIDMRNVLDTLVRVEQHLRREKCKFHKEGVKYLGLIIRRGGVKIDPDKVAAVQNSSVAQKTFDIWVFIRFANSYRRFIYNLSGIVCLLTALTGKCVTFKWSDKC